MTLRSHIQGEDNCIADALSRLPMNTFPEDKSQPVELHTVCLNKPSIPSAAILQVSMDTWVLNNIKRSYEQVAHDSLGHFGAEKSYAALCNCYYWLNMQKDFETLYIPECINCQYNKSCTTWPPGPLHPLLVPDNWADKIAINFIGQSSGKSKIYLGDLSYLTEK